MRIWRSCGMGTKNESLPSFVVMHDPRGGPISGSSNWTAGYMPAAYQGTLFRSTGQAVFDLKPAISNPRAAMDEAGRTAELNLLREFNARHQTTRAGDQDLAG